MMKCKIVQNEGFICILLLTCISVVYCAFVGENSQTIQELCTSNRFIYSVKTGEIQQFKLTSVSSQEAVNKWYQKSKRKCRKEFKTNNGAAHFVVVISNMSVPTCSEKCQCNYFEIAEPGYSEKLCGVNKEEIYFESKGDYLYIDFHHGASMLFEVTLTFTAKRNTYIITGSARDDGQQSGQFLETPYFPNAYQTDYISEYILQSNDERGHVMLMFVDFLLAPLSFIEVVGHNGTHPVVLYGGIFRPPIFVSEKNQLSLKFEANNGINIGFRAICFFLKDSDLKDHVPYSDCGGLLKIHDGGSINLEYSRSHNYYDCIWRLSTPMLLGSFSLIAVYNFTFENIGSKASLEFREGLTSKSKLVQSIDWDGLNASDIPAEVIVSASEGLYVRFNGFLNPHSSIKMIYITYYNGNCSESHLMCDGRCLFSTLRCDGIVHCYNGSDEEDCTTTSVLNATQPTVTKRGIHKKKTVITVYVVLLFGIVGIIAVIISVVFVFYRMHKKDPPVVENVEEPQVINEMTGPVPIPCPRVSLYSDQPPSYEDFLLSSDCYPPPLYTRAAKRHSEPFATYSRPQHTTSFCGKDVLEHRMVHSFDLHSLNSSNSNENSEAELFTDQPGCSFDRKWVFPQNQIPDSGCSLKRTTSWNSVLDKKASDCHFHLSITHSICPHVLWSPDVQCQSLPTSLKRSNEIGMTFQTSVPEVQCMMKQGFSSRVVCHETVSVKSEILTTVKARCHSEPCRRVSFCYSLHHKN